MATYPLEQDSMSREGGPNDPTGLIAAPDPQKRQLPLGIVSLGEFCSRVISWANE
jgi:hypothetical protein